MMMMIYLTCLNDKQNLASTVYNIDVVVDESIGSTAYLTEKYS